MSNATTTANTTTANVATEAVVQTSLFYLENAGVLYSIKPKDYIVIAGAPTTATLDKYFAAAVLKHNPTCVFNSSTGRKSFDPARPMIYLENGILIQQPLAAEPAKVEKSTSGGKTIKVAQVGPTTIYIRTSVSDTRPFSIKPDQLELLKTDASGLRYMDKLKHLPTCVEMSLVQGLISTDTNRPMYEMSEAGQLTQIFAPGMEPQVEVVEVAEVVAEVAAPKAKAKSKKAAK